MRNLITTIVLIAMIVFTTGVGYALTNTQTLPGLTLETLERVTVFKTIDQINLVYVAEIAVINVDMRQPFTITVPDINPGEDYWLVVIAASPKGQEISCTHGPFTPEEVLDCSVVVFSKTEETLQFYEYTVALDKETVTHRIYDLDEGVEYSVCHNDVPIPGSPLMADVAGILYFATIGGGTFKIEQALLCTGGAA